MRKENLMKTTCKYKLNIGNESFNVSMIILTMVLMQEQSDTLNYIDIDQTYEFFQPIHRFIFHYQSTEYLVRHLYYQLNWIKI